MSGPSLPNRVLFVVENQRLLNCFVRKLRTRQLLVTSTLTVMQRENERQRLKTGNLPRSERKEEYGFRNYG